MTPLPTLLAELFALTPQIAAAPSEQAADVLRVRRVAVTAEIESRCGGAA